MLLFVFVGAKRRRGEISKFQFLISANLRVVTFSLYSVPDSAADSSVSLIYFAVLSLVFELKQHLEAQPYPEKDSKPPKMVEITMELSSLYPALAIY